METVEAGMVPPCVLEEEHSMSGLSDCLVELEVEEGEREIPFRSYLDENAVMCDDVQDCSHSLSDTPNHTPCSSHTVSNPLLSPGTSFHKHFIPHGHIQRCMGGKDEDSHAVGKNQQPLGNYPEVQRSIMSPENRTPTRTSFLSSGRNSRTPNTLMRLQEKHRQNERVRHHTLIKNMKAVCSRVPGYDEKAKETKVVMLQRVVDYICHIEQHIQGLSDELGIKLDLSNTFLTTKIRKTSDERNKQMCSARSCYRKTADPFLATYIPESVEMMESEQPFAMSTPQTSCGISDDMDRKLQLRRQKISSPTVGSSSDATVPLLSEAVGSQSSLSSEDSHKPAPSNIPFVDEMTLSPSNTWISESDDVLSLHPKDDYLNPEESLGFEQPDDFGMSSSFPLGSPLRSNSVLDFGAGNGHLSDDHLEAVSPDRVLQIKSGPLLKEKLLQLIERKKESYLDRPPLTPITNMMRKDVKERSLSQQEELSQALTPIVDKNLRSDIGRKDDNYFVSYVPYMWKFHDMAMTRRQKAAAARTQTEKENGEAVVPMKDDSCKPVKVDLRKTSWMNGFMMFSRINRRTFIEANPGVHTSHISKMMGHTWRNMLEEEQRPYKEKAKKYMEYMQRSFEEPLSESETRLDAYEADGDISKAPFTPRDELKPKETIAQVVPDSMAIHDPVPRSKLRKYKKRGSQRLRGGRGRRAGTTRTSSLKSCYPGVSLLRKSEIKQEPSEEIEEPGTGIPLVRVKTEGEITPIKQESLN
ncbi:uncharacterized protein LOC135468350 isoform X2 [Liolophura sinensis]|uniref:uncharacterized protein LOC135468350 isoform X2 n=1 Tax=Liolophura sinensis TaxID=3198878 RepID=UPI00315953C7